MSYNELEKNNIDRTDRESYKHFETQCDLYEQSTAVKNMIDVSCQNTISSSEDTHTVDNEEYQDEFQDMMNPLDPFFKYMSIPIKQNNTIKTDSYQEISNLERENISSKSLENIDNSNDLPFTNAEELIKFIEESNKSNIIILKDHIQKYIGCIDTDSNPQGPGFVILNKGGFYYGSFLLGNADGIGIALTQSISCFPPATINELRNDDIIKNSSPNKNLEINSFEQHRTCKRWENFSEVNLVSRYISSISDDIKHFILYKKLLNENIYARVLYYSQLRRTDFSVIRNLLSSWKLPIFKGITVSLGTWVSGYQEGNGIRLNPANGGYIGGWLKSKRSGIGIYSGRSIAYLGSWLNDKRESFGIQVYSDGSVYIGEWKDDERSGYGFFLSNQPFESRLINSAMIGEKVLKALLIGLNISDLVDVYEIRSPDTVTDFFQYNPSSDNPGDILDFSKTESSSLSYLLSSFEGSIPQYAIDIVKAMSVKIEFINGEKTFNFGDNKLSSPNSYFNYKSLKNITKVSYLHILRLVINCLMENKITPHSFMTGTWISDSFNNGRVTDLSNGLSNIGKMNYTGFSGTVLQLSIFNWTNEVLNDIKKKLHDLSLSLILLLPSCSVNDFQLEIHQALAQQFCVSKNEDTKCISYFQDNIRQGISLRETKLGWRQEYYEAGVLTLSQNV